MNNDRSRRSLFASVATLACLLAGAALAQQPKPPPAAEARKSEPPTLEPKAPPGAASAASEMANFFRQVGDQIYTHCIFELSEEQLEVQKALIAAYVKQGATNALARQLAVKQIRTPELTEECKRIKASKAPQSVPAFGPAVVKSARSEPPPAHQSKPVGKAMPPAAVLTEKTVLPQWDCAPGVDYVTIQHRGYERKLSDGDICSPFEDVVRAVPDALATFRLGYTIETGRLYIISSDPQHNGRTIAWAISGRESCRNNPDPDCLAARAIGPLPPGEYAFASDTNNRVSWGPKTQRMVAGIWLKELRYRERYTPAQTAAILARGNIAIHVRLRGEMSEACLALGPKGWEYVASLIKDGRATGVSVYIEERFPQVAERPPVIRASSFSLSSLFK